MSDYRTDREFSDALIPRIKQIVGPFLIDIAPMELDAREATDLLVFKARDMRIAARVRRHGYADRYPWEFTIRAHRDSGAKTELAKIVEGWGDWLFYAHASGRGGFERWMIVDLHALRAALIRRDKGLSCGDKPNGDGTYFKWFDVRTFPASPPILVASSHDLPSADRPRHRRTDLFAVPPT